jgi:hypothetical protein
VPSSFVWTSSACLANVLIHCFDCPLVSTFTNETQVLSSVTHMIWMRNSSPSYGITLKKVKAETILCILCAPVSIFETHLAQNLW